MRFIGQENIVRELDSILPSIKENPNENLHFLFRAASGYGKTTLAYLCLNYLGFDNSCIYFPEGNELSPTFREKYRFHFIDEIHTLENPEFLYPLMDSGKYTFFFASNESGELKEPLLNRCIQFIFSPYTQEEITRIVEGSLGVNLPHEFIEEISSRCRGNPRVAKVLCKRLGYVFKNYKFPKTIEELQEILTSYLEIKSGGINRLDEIYMKYLKEVGGVSSLTNIIGGTGIDRSTILREIEPFLLYKKFIRITSKGRQLC